MRSETLYKVVRYYPEEPDIFYSINCPYGKYRLTYNVGKITVSEVGKIFCFRKLDRAKEFMEKFGDTSAFSFDKAILAGKATEVGKIKYMCLSRNFSNFWEEKIKKKSLKDKMLCGLNLITSCPKDSVVCSSFMPIDLFK